MKTISFEVPDHCVFEYGDIIEYRLFTDHVCWAKFLGYIIEDEDLGVFVEGGPGESDYRVDMRSVLGKRVRV